MLPLQVGLPVSYHSVHCAMTHWAELQELPKMEQVGHVDWHRLDCRLL
jgi:hypothetical protein